MIFSRIGLRIGKKYSDYMPGRSRTLCADLRGLFGKGMQSKGMPTGAGAERFCAGVYGSLLAGLRLGKNAAPSGVTTLTARRSTFELANFNRGNVALD